MLSPTVGSFAARIVTSVVTLGTAKLLNNLRLVSPNDTTTFTSVVSKSLVLLKLVIKQS